MSTDLGSAYFQLIPSLKGAQGKIESQLGASGAASGEKFNKGFSKSFAGTTAAFAGIALATAGIVKFTGFIGDSIQAVGNWQALNAQSAAAIETTGGAAKVTAKHVHDLGQAIENQTATQAESIQQGANLLLTFKGIRNEAGKGNDIFDQTTKAAVDMARAMGTDVPSAALQLGKALNDPTAGLSKLTRSGVTFTAQQKQQIKALQAAGDTMGAQKVILKELNSEFGGAGAAYAKTYEGSMYRLSDAVGDFGEKIATAALPGITKLIDTGTDIVGWATNSGLITRVGDAISSVFAGISSSIKNIDFTAVSTNVKNALGGIQTLATQVFPPVIAAFSKLGPALGDSLGKILPIVATTLSQLAPTLATVVPLLAQTAATVLPSIAQLLIAIAPILPPVATALASLAPAIATIITAITPLIAAQAGLLSFFGAIAKGGVTSSLIMDGLKGKFGPLVQALGTFGAAVGLYIGGAIVNFRNFASNVGQVVANVGGFISRAISTFNRMRDGILTAVTGAIVGILNFGANTVAAFGRLAAGVAGKVGEVIRFVASIPGKARGALGNIAGLLFSSGQALIRGFIDGIGSMIGAVGAKVASVMSKVKEYIPHSPAKRGPLSGSGWKSIATGGQALATQFTSGFNGGVKDFASGIGSLVPDTITSSVSGSIGAVSHGGGSQPIYTDHGVLFGMIQRAADGTARLVLDQQNASDGITQRLGYQPAVFG